MDSTTAPLQNLLLLKEVMMLHGPKIALAIIVLIIGVFIAKWLTRLFGLLVSKMTTNLNTISTAKSVFGALLLGMVFVVAAAQAGLDAKPVMRLLIIILLGIVCLILFFRPYIPGLPFKVGQTVHAGGILGKVEGATVLNTRLKTFDGKTVFIPNRLILNDVAVNYHYTPTRRAKLDVPIQYDQDLMKAKQVLETVMIEDPRVLRTPRPLVWVLNISNGCIMLGGRCWIDNLKYWTTRCDLLEKIIFRFRHEGIVISYPHIRVHHFNEDQTVEESLYESENAFRNR